MQHIVGKLSTRATTLIHKFISIRGLNAKLWALKVVEIAGVGILRFPLKNPKTK